jgi:hypothetical protein
MHSSPRPSTAARILFAALVCAPVSAAAKDICLTENQGGGTFVFQKVKKFKVGRAVALTGVYINHTPAESFPVEGAAVLRAAGNVEVGVTVHQMSANTFGSSSFTASMQVSATLEGTGGIDTDGDGAADLTTYGWAATDCKQVVIP